jgi:hypothetical protein
VEVFFGDSFGKGGAAAHITNHQAVVQQADVRMLCALCVLDPGWMRQFALHLL